MPISLFIFTIIIHLEFSLLILILSCHALLRDASTDAILDEDAAINLPFVDVAFVIPIIHYGHSLRCLLRHPELELPAAAVVLGERPSDGLERVTSSGNPDLERSAARVVLILPAKYVSMFLGETSAYLAQKLLVHVIHRHNKILPGIPRNTCRPNHIILVIQDLPLLVQPSH